MRRVLAEVAESVFLATAARSRSQRSTRYDFFLSYAHEDRERVRQFDRSLRELLRRPFRRYGFQTFRDEAALQPGDDLDQRLREGMRVSSWLLVVLTYTSSRSRWVNREIDYWCRDLQRTDRMIIVRADEAVDMTWDEDAASFAAPERLPSALVDAVQTEPLWVNAVNAACTTWHDPAVQVAAAVLKRPPEDVAGEDYRLHRQRRRRVAQAVSVLAVTTVVALFAGAVAVRSSVAAREAQERAERARKDAEDNATMALAQQAQALASDEPALALALSAEALTRLPNQETAEILQRA